MKKRVLIIATSRQTKGGISSVVLAHEKGKQWVEYHCKWIETHSDKNVVVKLLTLIVGWQKFMLCLPFAKIVHVHLSEPPSAMRKCLFIIPTLLLRKKYIAHFHSFSPDTTTAGRYDWLYKFIFTKADVVVVLSNYWKDAVNSSFYLGDKVRVVYNPCINVPLKNNHKKEKMILYAGAINQRKGYADLIKAFSVIAPKHCEWRLVFAGSGEIEKGKELARQIGVDRQCVFLGWINGTVKDSVFGIASVFCLPSYAEGFPMGVLDAMSYGLPVITTPVGGIPDIADDGNNMLLFEPGDTQKLAQCLDILISNVELRKKLSVASINLASTTFNIDTVNSQIGKIYEELI